MIEIRAVRLTDLNGNFDLWLVLTDFLGVCITPAMSNGLMILLVGSKLSIELNSINFGALIAQLS